MASARAASPRSCIRPPRPIQGMPLLSARCASRSACSAPSATAAERTPPPDTQMPVLQSARLGSSASLGGGAKPCAQCVSGPPDSVSHQHRHRSASFSGGGQSTDLSQASRVAARLPSAGRRLQQAGRGSLSSPRQHRHKPSSPGTGRPLPPVTSTSGGGIATGPASRDFSCAFLHVVLRRFVPNQAPECRGKRRDSDDGRDKQGRKPGER